MHRKSFIPLFLMAAVLLAVPALAAQQETEVGKARTVDLPRQARVGDVMLPAGRYRLRHFQRGDEHIMVFENERRKEMARVLCTMEARPGKASGLELHYLRNEAGEYVLSALVLPGDRVTHKLQP
jgi:hypothetical protein